jgi:tetratricopeptide (TPR) repeat protein
MAGGLAKQKTDVPVNSLGGRIRQARMEARLSLAAVAKNDFSRAFLNQVELGRSRPSPKNLKIIAERLGRPMAFFMQDQEEQVVAAQNEYLLVEAQIALMKGEQLAVVKLLDPPTVAAMPLPDRMVAQLYRAEALVHLRRGSEALDSLGGVLEFMEKSGSAIQVTRGLDALGGAYAVSNRLEEALGAYERARREYDRAQLEEPDLLARIMSHIASTYLQMGQSERAVAAYEAGLESTEHFLDLPRRAHLYDGLAFSYHQAGNLLGALEYARKAVRIFEQLHHIRLAARLQHNMAEILVNLDRLNEAETLYRRAIDSARQAEVWEQVPLSLASLADLSLRRNRLEDATRLVEEGVREARKLGIPAPLAACQRVAARLARSRQDWAASDAAFEEAIKAYGDAALVEYLAEAHSEYASSLRERGELARAAAHFEEAYEIRRSGPRSVKAEAQASTSA